MLVLVKPANGRYFEERRVDFFTHESDEIWAEEDGGSVTCISTLLHGRMKGPSQRARLNCVHREHGERRRVIF